MNIEGKVYSPGFGEEVWQRDSLLDIAARFMHLEFIEKEVEGRKVKKETMIFPRYHQLDSVRKLEAAAKIEKAGHNIYPGQPRRSRDSAVSRR